MAMATTLVGDEEEETMARAVRAMAMAMRVGGNKEGALYSDTNTNNESAIRLTPLS